MAIAAGSRVFLHQAFRCCPYAGAVTSQIHDYLEQNGYVITPNAEEADVHLVNTCGSDAGQSELTWHALQTIAKRAPEAPVVVTGCLVSIDPKRLAAELAPVNGVARLDPRHLDGLDDVFAPKTRRFADVQPALHAEYAGNDFSQGWLHVVASTGCLGTCQFCAIRRATGRPKSRSIEAILADIRRGLAEGLHDILLVSTDLSAWGTDFGGADAGKSVVDLIRAVTAEPGEFRLAGESFEPTLFLEHFEELLPLFTSGRWTFVGLPIQSGSRRVLASMERTYDPQAVVAAVKRLQAAATDLVIRTDLLYGFGDETEAEFQESLAVSRAFDLPSFNCYQQRPGTPAVRLSAEVLNVRREAAFAELHARAQAGLPPLRRWGGRVDRSVAEPSGDSHDVKPPPEPWETDEGYAWLVDTGRRFAKVLARHRSLALARGWALAEVRVDEGAVILGLRHAGGRGVDVGLRKAGWPGAAMARGERYALWVMGQEVAADAGLDEALKRLVGALGAG